MKREVLGAWGESMAARYYRKRGYSLLDARYRTRFGEIDLVAEKGDLIVFVEVKTRTGFEYGTPAMAVDKNKKAHIKQTAKVYIHLNRLYNYEIEFDVIEVIIMNGKCKVNHLKQVM